MEHVLLKDVTPESQQWTVRTRVVRFSEYVTNDSPPRTLRIDLILLDEEGKAMEGQIPGNWIELFKPQLKEDNVYYIKYFQVRHARPNYRPVDHAYMMRFTAHTRVHELKTVPDNFPLYAHAAVPFEVLRTRIGINEYCSDVIGVFTGCSNVKTQNTRGGAKMLRNIYITDGRETVAVALWGQHADSFDAQHYMELGRTRPLVFLFCAMTCRMYDGKLSLQGSTLCKWYANPVLPEVSALQDSCIGRIPPPTWYGPAGGLVEPERISVADLSTFDNPHIIYNNRYIITAKIKNVVQNQSWWYLACDECTKTIQPHGAGYKCTGAKCKSTSGSPRYRLSVIAVDHAPPTEGNKEHSVELVFFGPTAEEIIGVPVAALIASQAGVGAFLPTRITTLYGKTFELRISVSPGSLQRINITYQVDAVIGATNLALPAPESVSTLAQLPTNPESSNQSASATPSAQPEGTQQITLMSTISTTPCAHIEAPESPKETESGDTTPPPSTPVTPQMNKQEGQPAKTNADLDEATALQQTASNVETEKRQLNDFENENDQPSQHVERRTRRKLALHEASSEE